MKKFKNLNSLLKNKNKNDLKIMDKNFTLN